MVAFRYTIFEKTPVSNKPVSLSVLKGHDNMNRRLIIPSIRHLLDNLPLLKHRPGHRRHYYRKGAVDVLI